MIQFGPLFLCFLISPEVHGLKCYVEKVSERFSFLSYDEENTPLLDCHDPKIEDISSESPVPRNYTSTCYTFFGKRNDSSGLYVTGKGCMAADECKYLEKNYGDIHKQMFLECRECSTDGCNKFFNDASKPKNFVLIIIILGIVGVSVLILSCITWRVLLRLKLPKSNGMALIHIS